MMVNFDETEFELPAAAVAGLQAFLKGVAIGMIRADPENAECWAWGRAYIRDLSHGNSVTFEWGDKDSKPDDNGGSYAVVREAPQSREGASHD